MGFGECALRHGVGRGEGLARDDLGLHPAAAEGEGVCEVCKFRRERCNGDVQCFGKGRFIQLEGEMTPRQFAQDDEPDGR
jgi:hypothetical protein